MINEIRKRDGSIVKFDKDKITNAIFKAVKAVGGGDRKLAEGLANKVVAEVEKSSKGHIPAVEEVQDTVERVLIEKGHAKTAKAYIIYRQKRKELREEKKLILEKNEIDEVDKKFDVNALRVLKGRYLRKDEAGKLIETPKQLFTRIAVHAALPNIFYDKKVFLKEGKGEVHPDERFNNVEYEDKISIGKYKLNRYHLEAAKRLYDRFNKEGKMKLSWSKFFEMLKSGKMNNHEKAVDDFYELMVSRKFMPNTPAIVNFGNPLGMGSACFHPDQVVIAQSGPKRISEIKEGELVLTHNGRFKEVMKVFERNATELFEVNCHKLPNKTLLVTAEHPILCYENNEAVWKSVSELSQGDMVALSYPAEVQDMNTISVGQITGIGTNESGMCTYSYKGGKFDTFKHDTKPVKNTVSVDFDLMKVFGYYLAEGNVSKNECVRFTFSEDEEDVCNEIISTVKNKFGVDARIEKTNRANRKWISIRFHSTILAKFFNNLFGTGFDKKSVPAWILTLPVDKQRGLILAMLKGDGTIFKNYKQYNARVVMCNSNLIYAFWQLCMRSSIFASLKIESMPRLGTKNPVICTIGTDGYDIINQAAGKNIQSMLLSKKQYINVNGVIFTPVTEIKRIDYSGLVYNLEVEDDNSYVANMVSVHNCFVYDVQDSLESIFETLKRTAIVFQSGGGMGYNFSKLRPEGDFVSTTHGVASGPLSFMRMFDTMTEVIKQGGVRRGANMGILNSNHPDIEKFIVSKSGNKALRNFNISVLIMPDFWKHYESGEPYPLINPRNGEIVRYIDAAKLFDSIVYQAWESAEPGVIFFDHMNKYNPFYEHLGPIVTTNPCGEVLLYPNESCNLGSINVWAFAKENEDGNAYTDWEDMKNAIRLATRFLDNIIDVNKFPLKEIEEMTLATRKIGIGVMGLGDLLYELRLPYNSDEGRQFMEILMEFVNYYTKVESIELAKERGPMPYLEKSFYPQGRLPFKGFEQKEKWHFNWSSLAEQIKKHGVRNGYTTVIAPTGSISMIAGTSSGIEPVYSLVFEKNVKIGSFYYIDPVFEKFMRKEGLYDEDLLADIAHNSGSLQGIPYLLPGMKSTFVTAMDIRPEDHIRALAAFQTWTDSSISKTNNFPANATVEYMKESYLLAYRLGCKDVTVYRDSSIKDQVLVSTSKEKIHAKAARSVNYEPERLASQVVATGQETFKPTKSGGMTNCPSCDAKLENKEGCLSCPSCGFGLCP